MRGCVTGLTHINKEKIMSSVQSWPCVWSESPLCNHWPTYSTYRKSSLICFENLVCYCDFLSNENTQRHTTWAMATKEALHWGRTWVLAGFVSVTELKEGFVVSNRIQEQQTKFSRITVQQLLRMQEHSLNVYLLWQLCLISGSTSLVVNHQNGRS